MMIKYIYKIDIFVDFNISTNGNYILSIERVTDFSFCSH
jgi:hypothetical protein